MKNEGTIFLDGIMPKEGRKKKEEANPWKLVTLGGVAGVLMGAGSLYTGQIVAKELKSDDIEENSSKHTTENGLKVADVEQEMSFSQAFASARAEVGPGGFFHWHGGIYNTYTAEEWSSMSQAEKNAFAQQVHAEVRADEIPTPSDEHPDIAVHHANEVSSDDVHVVENASEPSNQDSDVHIIGYTNVQGHLTVGLDMNGDGQADVAIIDVDNNQEVSSPDLVIDRDGNYATIGKIVNDRDPNMEAANEVSDVPEEPSAEADYPLYDF